MGLLDVGASTLSWDEVERTADFIREHGAIQFLQLYQHFESYENPVLKWGEEMEYHIIELSPTTRQVSIYVQAYNLIEMLNKAEESIQGSFHWNPEYGSWVIESIPSEPYNESVTGLLSVENKLSLRRRKLRALLSSINKNVFPLSMPVFPLLGVPGYFSEKELQNEVTQSQYLDDRIISQHPRFSTITRSIMTRKKRTHELYAPLFMDENTTAEDEPKPGFIHMDTCGFGMGNCCLQVTFNTKNIHEARCLYDHLLPFASILPAVAACSPFFKGKLAASDTRWEVLSQAMDDRTEEEIEQGIRPRFGGIPCYLCEKGGSEWFNDVAFHYDENTYQRLLNGGISPILAKHLAWVFSRDPLVVFSDKIELDDMTETTHFENFQSTNWNSLRFKPPPSHSSTVGWRIEFRPLDIQLTDFENAAFCVLIILISRMILSLQLSFKIPISKIDENIKRSNEMDAVLTQKFWFRRNYVPAQCEIECRECQFDENCDALFQEMTLKEIFLGNETFYGIFELIRRYLTDIVKCSPQNMERIERYLEFFRRRLTGEIPTGARFLRSFIMNHPEYKKDSVISSGIAFDMINLCSPGEWIEELLGPVL